MGVSTLFLGTMELKARVSTGRSLNQIELGLYGLRSQNGSGRITGVGREGLAPLKAEKAYLKHPVLEFPGGGA